MADQGLYDYFITHHLPRGEVLNRLPLSVSIGEFWPALQQLRKARAVKVPLAGLDGEPLWFVMTDSIMASGDRIASMARRDIDSIRPGEDAMTDGLMDEAFFTSFVEGAPVSRLESRRFLKSGEDPANVGELLVQNNLSAIRYMAGRLYEPFTGNMLLSAARLLTSAMETETEEYRQADGHQIPGRDRARVRVPPAADIPGMMDSLCLFLNEYEMHPLLKAAIAHAYILLVRPFDEGNERLARLLAYNVLLRKGYSFFRQFALSGMIAKDGILYYQAINSVEDGAGGGDLTCFLDYYLGMLARGVAGFDAYIARKRDEEAGRREETAPACRAEQADPARESLDAGPPPVEAAARPVPAGAGEERERRMGECATPETLVPFIIRQQGTNIALFDTRPYFDKLGLTSEKVLTVLRGMNSDSARRTLAMYRLFQSDPARKYTCRAAADAMRMTIGTARRTCYILATLNLARAAPASAVAPAHGNHRKLMCFSCYDAAAA